ncbi:50S ribosomal protein L15 [Fontivita pretiosa]|uniref:50S ribosomal protein L15 n=1 Tax=Fontivita pretiosa TaxID=2989684 RepID=UPI003D16EE5C
MSMIHDITAEVGGHKAKRRKGRGRSSGRGKTAGRGTKGSKARVGKYIKPTYEGGQTELFRRFPKRGFSNDPFQHRYHIVNVAALAERFEEGATVDQAALIDKGLVPDDRLPVKVLGEGQLGKRLTVVAGWFSRSAYEKITQAGGTAQNLKGEPFEFPKPRKKFVPREGGAKKSKPAAEAAPASAEPAKTE